MWKLSKGSGNRTVPGFKDFTVRKGHVILGFAFCVICVIAGLSCSYRLSNSEPTEVRRLSTGSLLPHLRILTSQAYSDDEVPTTERASESMDSRTVVESLEDVKLGDENDGVPQGCDSNAELKVYMYDLPPEFHYGMISAFEPKIGKIWPANASQIPPYPGGLYQQHSPEYWLTSDLLTSNMQNREAPCTAFRVERWEDADFVFVPFFASLSYNRYGKVTDQMLVEEGSNMKHSLYKDKNEELQAKLVQYLEKHPAWKASNGKNHVMVIHHPNSMQAVRDRLRNALYVVSDFGRYENETANIRKDVVAPYKHVLPTFTDDSSSFHTRSTVVYFQGSIVRKEGGKIRHELYDLLKDEPDVHFTTGITASEGFHSATRGMRSSRFCLNLAGDTPSSNRLFDSIASHCVPVIISDDLELPFEDDLNYSSFCIFINSTRALQPGYVINLLRNVSSEEWTLMWERLLVVERHFEYQFPSVANDAVNMVWKAIARKLPAIRLTINKERRYMAKPSWRRSKLGAM
ncbi:probable arabinosyltransferase ARAD1 [Physcomitrium patens]|uniref:Exostosin GT47 domain-containing protein n=1 Tax=Physcomitrium patens TaxID=3218 RepID=A0A2K1JT27_PHYPA|nr:probable arabinosyltransferase ARAD1 [Physcomitrium patens]PNR44682.1 hypothetical protein PHYPA_014452 [Physcomitrium patens]|eukprot:XP_024388252.1 probable arabinosyltransferase ARAD1 [Physcomitrella patens]